MLTLNTPLQQKYQAPLKHEKLVEKKPAGEILTRHQQGFSDTMLKNQLKIRA